MAGVGGLRELVSQPLWRRWTLAAFLARLPITMALLALLLVGQEATGSLAVGAQLAGVATVAAGLAAPFRGRQLDSRELRTGLERACLTGAAVIAAEAVALVMGAPLWLLFALAAVQGIALAALTGGYRALLVPVVPPGDLARANTMDAVAIEVAFMSGPALASLLAVPLGAVGALGAMSAALVCAFVATRGLPHLHPASERSPAAPWRARGAMPIYLLALAIGVCVGLLESAVPARLEQLGIEAAASGWLLTLVAAGSAAGGLIVSLGDNQVSSPQRRAAVLLALFALLLAPIAALGSVGWIAVALFVCGAPIAPVNALAVSVLSDVVPAGRQAEGFALLSAAVLIGAGLGQSLTGQLLDAVGPQALLWGSAALPLGCAAAVAASVVVARRRPAVSAPG